MFGVIYPPNNVLVTSTSLDPGPLPVINSWTFESDDVIAFQSGNTVATNQ